ncbi:MAG: hypothetical protein JSW17_04275 [Candidatus Omnitrophota bacterium]|nr:MAG: hypothetical protein JSW17_04275 [Candidatus Omnitrophota bacterium]
MKIKILFCVVLISIFSATSIVTGHAAQNSENISSDHVTVYYFHQNFRCINCRNIEQYAKEVVEQSFVNELLSGRLFFKAINVEEKSNEHFVNDYQLYTRSLVLSLVKNGKEIESKNLTKVWEYLRNKSRFQRYVKDEITDYLNKL